MLLPTFAALPILAGVAAPPPDRAGPLDGRWGGDRTIAVVQGRRVTLSWDCAAGSFLLPADKPGTKEIAVPGRFTPFAGGPTRGDGGSAGAAVVYHVRVTGDTMQVAFARDPQANRQVYRLVRNARTKLVRCL